MGEELPAALREVTDAERETFWRDGVVCLREILPAQWIAVVERGVERWLASSSRFSLSDFGTRLTPAGGRPRAHFYGGTDHWKTDSDCRRFACESPLPALVGRLLSATKVNLYEDSILVKEPGAIERTMFHQDLPYFHVEGTQVCTSWIPLDPVTRETGSLLFVKGSHAWKKLYRPNYFVQTGSIPDTEGEEAPDYHAVDASSVPARPRTSLRDAEILCFEMKPGDLTVHHGLTLHGAEGNSSNGRRRRAMSVRYCGDDARYRIRRGAAQKPHHAGVRAGEVLDHTDCPVVWSTNATSTP
ncbi:MAG: phytanoyl-CoA dioxygenase family protein [Deltaproteobacteria bacterium]|nr:phytanoyl-CoA dioxygenase family protein [Deltaproteobacteria bacterium]